MRADKRADLRQTLSMLPEGAPNVASIKTAEVRRQPLARSLRVAGMIEDDESKHRILSAYTGGRIEKLFVNFEGAEVQAGQPLATFYSKDLIAAIREYKVAYGQGPSPMLTASAVRLEQLGLSKDQIAKAHERNETDIFVDILAPVTGTVVKRYVYRRPVCAGRARSSSRSRTSRRCGFSSSPTSRTCRF